MSNITLFGSDADDYPIRLPRSTKKALDQVQGHGLVSAGKVEAAGLVAHVAIQEIGLLSMEEALLVGRCPHSAARAKAIVDQFTGVAAATIARMGY